MIVSMRKDGFSYKDFALALNKGHKTNDIKNRWHNALKDSSGIV